MTQQRLADDIGISQSAVAAYERDFREPDFATVRRFADFFHVPFTSMLPSSGNLDDDFIVQIADCIHQNPKLGILFDKARFMTDANLDAILAVVNAISKERDQNG